MLTVESENEKLVPSDQNARDSSPPADRIRSETRQKRFQDTLGSAPAIPRPNAVFFLSFSRVSVVRRVFSNQCRPQIEFRRPLQHSILDVWRPFRRRTWASAGDIIPFLPHQSTRLELLTRLRSAMASSRPENATSTAARFRRRGCHRLWRFRRLRIVASSVASAPLDF